jgi:polyisoprenoid-binding protein YceI
LIKKNWQSLSALSTDILKVFTLAQVLNLKNQFMKKMLLFAFALVAMHSSLAQSHGFKITEMFPVDVSHSYIGFSIKYMGYAMVRGRFTDFRGAIRFDEKDLQKTSVTIVVDANSINTGDSWRDDDLRSDNWLGVQHYPKIFFISKKTDVTPSGLLISGDLTMHGITKEVSIPLDRPIGIVKDVRGDSQIIFTGVLAINRIDFGIEGKKWAGVVEGITAVSDEVNIELTILAKRINAGNFKNWVEDVRTPHGRIYNVAKAKGVDKALVAFDSIRSSANHTVGVETLNTAGQMLLKENKVQEALVLFKRNDLAYPKVSIVYESYGEALATSGQWEEALKSYKTAIEVDEWSVVAKEVIRSAGQ